MKNSLPILILSLIAGFHANATDVIQEPASTRSALANKTYEWSFGALSKTMKEMRNGCEKTNGDEFIEIGNWARSRNGKFSINELVQKCQTISKFEQLFRGETDSSGVEKLCEHPDASACSYNLDSQIPINCGEKPWSQPTRYGTRNWGCDIFISTFIKNNNEIAGLGLRGPGTYVQRIPDAKATHGPTYQIIDVILADNYYTKDRAGRPTGVNFDVNIADQNTMIYEVFDWGLVTPLIGTNGEVLHTWTNDMFLDVRAAAGNPMGDMGGVAVNAFIMPTQDVSYRIYDIYNTNRGLWGASITNGRYSAPGKPYDIKEQLGPEFIVSAYQAPETSDKHGNGLMFNGKIATIDWLGNLLYSMNSNEAQYGAPQRWAARMLADFISTATNWKSNYRNRSSRDPQTFRETLHDIGRPASDIVYPEPVTVQQAFQVGNELVADLRRQRDERFKDIQTGVESEAYALAKRIMETSIDNGGYGAHNVVCTGNCGPSIRPGAIGGTDVVSCTGYDANNAFFVQDFAFDDICNNRAIKQRSLHGNPVTSYPNGQVSQQ